MKKLFLTLVLAICCCNVFGQTYGDFIPERKAFYLEGSTLAGFSLRSGLTNYTLLNREFLYLNSNVSLVLNYNYQQNSEAHFRSNLCQLGLATTRKITPAYEIVSGISAGADWQRLDGKKTCRAVANLIFENRLYVNHGTYFVIGSDLSCYRRKVVCTFSFGIGKRW